ncbi:UDP-3-O-(3-hydroxymyristoyl)glucosamine N-acyltransferase [Paenibacillus sp. OAS669]|uniref:UDP-3-O-(3-hydroxymyristoyl)glucosamine N-acyltransferase n=1 Tax=Paenibacillus sp. OAS669 TaxID=2663821 RepID=UPI00178BB117|nr:UDP-3-O-(3-hydroxymyristoyl)glucosamine N-acyltransferase [Paenibacillus sp. OAS669]MBE1445666.1 UDP-3-O-[3-hydroxymyristoyl] glucosamine N-acyltransferase [Paenibacillus sp. OAS669]
MSQRELLMSPILLSEIAELFHWEFCGSDKEILKFGNLNSPTEYAEKQITYINSIKLLERYKSTTIGACVVHNSLKNSLPNDRSFLLVDLEPEVAFYEIFNFCLQKNKFAKIESNMGENCIIADNATIHDSVIIGDNCIIMDNVVLMPNTILGNNVVVKPNSVIGSDGFQVKIIDGKRKVVPHVGGVLISDNVEIGASVCIDKGLFGEFTKINKNTKIDNHVHLAHSVSIGEDCIITAGTIIAGYTVVGDSVWIAPNSTINQVLSIGSNSFICSGTVVTASISNNVQILGAPGRVIGWVCKCRSKLIFENGHARCNSCNIDYKLENKEVLVVS